MPLHREGGLTPTWHEESRWRAQVGGYVERQRHGCPPQHLHPGCSSPPQPQPALPSTDTVSSKKPLGRTRLGRALVPQMPTRLASLLWPLFLPGCQGALPPPPRGLGRALHGVSS